MIIPSSFRLLDLRGKQSITSKITIKLENLSETNKMNRRAILIRRNQYTHKTEPEKALRRAFNTVLKDDFREPRVHANTAVVLQDLHNSGRWLHPTITGWSKFLNCSKVF